MIIGQKIRQVREQKGLSQADIARATGMFRGYISRVEHGYTVPSLETLHRFAGALDVPIYQLFQGWEEQCAEVAARPSQEEEQGILPLLTGCVRSMPETSRALLLEVARKLAYRRSVGTVPPES